MKPLSRRGFLIGAGAVAAAAAVPAPIAAAIEPAPILWTGLTTTGAGFAAGDLVSCFGVLYRVTAVASKGSYQIEKTGWTPFDLPGEDEGIKRYEAA